MTNKNFDAYSRYYDLINDDKSYDLEVDYICSLLRCLEFVGKDILEFGSGTGIHGRMLANRGFNVQGVELSHHMIDKALEIDGFSCIQGDIRYVDLGKKFDIVLSLFHVISYQVTNDDLVKSFRTAALHLKKGGLFIFDVWYSPAVYAQKPSVRTKYKEIDDLKLLRVSEPTIFTQKNQVDVKFKIFDNDSSISSFENFEEKHSMRHFSIPEIELLANFTGFKLIKSEEFLTSNSPSTESWGVCFVLEKVDA